MSNLEKLKRCFCEALSLPSSSDVEKLAYQEHPAWDSVAHMRLVASIETAFDIMLETDQILEMSTFDKAKEIVIQHDIALDA